jgi:hypothetical protein
VTVEDLINELRLMPLSATVEAQIRKNVSPDQITMDDLYEFREAPIATVVYTRGLVLIQLDE